MQAPKAIKAPPRNRNTPPMHECSIALLFFFFLSKPNSLSSGNGLVFVVRRSAHVEGKGCVSNITVYEPLSIVKKKNKKKNNKGGQPLQLHISFILARHSPQTRSRGEKTTTFFKDLFLIV